MRAKLMGLSGVSNQFGLILVSVIGGFLIDAFSRYSAFYMVSVISIFGGFRLAWIYYRKIKPMGNIADFRKQSTDKEELSMVSTTDGVEMEYGKVDGSL
mmetsp:Transcript_525/g.475  ORF Transcript_525/g.475 Transcript_525/m.475 type:complete len:99 (-) Transcript_525:43-339(-)